MVFTVFTLRKHWLILKTIAVKLSLYKHRQLSSDETMIIDVGPTKNYHNVHASDATRPGFELSIPVKKSWTTVSMTERISHFLPSSVSQLNVLGDIVRVTKTFRSCSLA